MTTKQDEFNLQMQRGDNAFFEEDWPTAIDAYSRAIQAKPESPDAHINLGLVLMHEGQLDRALKVYKRANQLSPDDPLPLERSADVLERMGRLKEAAQQYVKVSDVYLGMRDLKKAIGNWERATQLTPGLISVHARLAQAYERIGSTKRAVREYLTLAFNFRRIDDVPKAIRAVERALKISPDNPQALNALRALQAGGDVMLPEELKAAQKRDRDKKRQRDDEDIFAESRERKSKRDTVGEADPRGPVGESLSHAMELLAAHVVESGLSDFVGFAMQGMQLQRQGAEAEAIVAYRQAVDAGLNHPSLKMNLGGLLVLNDQPEDGRKYLGEAVTHPELAAGAFHGIGLAHHKLGDQTAAARYLIQSLQAVDISLTTNQNEISELRTVYDSLIMALEGRSTEALSLINERFIGLLSGNDWKKRIAETRRHLDETLRDEGDQGLVDFLVAKGGDELASLVSTIDRYIRNGFYILAMDEAHRAVERSPHYLPVHVRMAEVMMKEGRIRQAINKYNMVARSYLVRDENDRAASILEEVLVMAPLDVEVRMNLIELLENENRMEEALNQYIDLANTYQQLGDFDKANETYNAAERLARRINAPATKIVEIKHHIADINQMRLNTRQAQKVYEEILGMVDNDEKALRGLVDIYFSQGNEIEAIKRFDALLSIYAKKGMITKLTQLLEEFVKQYPQNTALRSRLASIYRKLRRTQEAIEQLDALGELQLDAGLNKDAANTIRQIIAMNPPRIDDYKRLLAQLSGY